MAESENTSTSWQPPAWAKDKTSERSGQTLTIIGAPAKPSSTGWPKHWVDKTSERSNRTLTIIGAPRPKPTTVSETG